MVILIQILMIVIMATMILIVTMMIITLILVIMMMGMKNNGNSVNDNEYKSSSGRYADFVIRIILTMMIPMASTMMIIISTRVIRMTRAAIVIMSYNYGY